MDEIKREFGIERLRDFAVSASGLTEQTPGSMVPIQKRQTEEGFASVPDTPQLIFIWNGTNNWFGAAIQKRSAGMCFGPRRPCAPATQIR